MKYLYLDCETWRFQQGRRAPRLVCVSFHDPARAYFPGRDTHLYTDGLAEYPLDLYHRMDWRDWLPRFVHALGDDDCTIVNQNMAFDIAIIMEFARETLPESQWWEFSRLVWRKLSLGLFRCTMIRAMLIAIYRGKLSYEQNIGGKYKGFSLLELCKRYPRIEIGGKEGNADDPRLNYHLMDATPVSQWPANFREYAVKDPVYARLVWEAETLTCQTLIGADEPRSEARNMRAAYSLFLAECWGVRTDGAYVQALARYLSVIVDKADPILIKAPWIRPIDFSRNKKILHAEIVKEYAAKGLKAPRTAKGNVKDGREILRVAGTPAMVAYADSDKARKELSTFVPAVMKGVDVPINSYWNPLVESERLSSRGPNLTNPSTRVFCEECGSEKWRQCGHTARVIGVRPCYIARPGFVLSACDYSTAELRAFAQVCLNLFGYSRMAEVLREEYEAIKAGKPYLDLHDTFAAVLLMVDTDRALEMKYSKHPSWGPARDIAKRFNFGKLGGMGIPRFVITSAQYGIHLDVATATAHNALWIETWPEVPMFFRWINSLLRQSGQTRIMTEDDGTEREIKICTMTSAADGLQRGSCKYTDACNHVFQNYVAQWIKDAMFLIDYECYHKPAGSELFGSRKVIVPHDETILEVLLSNAHNAAMRQAQVMVDAAERLTPDIPIVVESALMERWYKDAKPVTGPDGRMAIWRPRQA